MNFDMTSLPTTDANDHTERIAAVTRLHEATGIYTEAHVVDELLGRLRWPCAMEKFCDPSAGDGAVLVRALDKLIRLRQPDDDEILAVLEGWEIHTPACEAARENVAGILIDAGRAPVLAAEVARRMIHNRDFLTDGPTSPQYSFCVGNPPYLRWLNVPKFLRDLYAGHVPPYAAGDLQHSFLDRCTRALIAGGQLGFITSDRWLCNSGAAKLRASIGRTLSIEHLERVDPTTSFRRPKNRRAGSPPRIHPVSVVLGYSAGRALTMDPIYPGVDEDQYAGMPTLSDIAQVRIGPWLGSKGVFFVSAAEAAASKLPPSVLVPAIDTDDIAGGVMRAPSRFAIRTKPELTPPDEVLEHLRRTMGKMAARGRDGHPWMPPERFHQIDLRKRSLLVPRIAKTPRAVRIPPGVLAVNHNVSIVCADEATLDFIEHALTSELAKRWVAEHAAALENGYYSLTTTLLRKLPIAESGDDLAKKMGTFASAKS